jgi:hypothetical protein
MRSDGLNIGVIGAGAWGTALARLLTNSGNSVQLWCREPETAKNILQKHVNTSFLPDILLPESLGASTNLLEIVRNSRILVAASPSHFTREIAKKIRPEITAEHILLILSKGIEQHSLALMSEIFAEELDNLPKLAVLSGPTFAREVALDLPSAAVLACADETVGILLQKCAFIQIASVFTAVLNLLAYNWVVPLKCDCDCFRNCRWNATGTECKGSLNLQRHCRNVPARNCNGRICRNIYGYVRNWRFGFDCNRESFKEP